MDLRPVPFLYRSEIAFLDKGPYPHLREIGHHCQRTFSLGDIAADGHVAAEHLARYRRDCRKRLPHPQRGRISIENTQYRGSLLQLPLCDIGLAPGLFQLPDRPHSVAGESVLTGIAPCRQFIIGLCGKIRPYRLVEIRGAESKYRSSLLHPLPETHAASLHPAGKRGGDLRYPASHGGHLAHSTELRRPGLRFYGCKFYLLEYR